MNKLEYQINCLDGVYNFAAEYDDVVIFNIETNIEKLNSFSGELDDASSKLFIEYLNKAQIEKWDREYKAELSEIEDGIRWEIRYLKDEKEYVSCGEESYQPYNYEELISAIRLCDKENDYLF